MVERCQAQRKKGAGPCTQPVVPGRKQCRFHGGIVKPNQGVDHPNWKHGNRSLVPRQMSDRLTTFLAADEWFNLQPRIALYKEQMERLAAEQPEELWDDKTRREMRAMDETHRRLIDTAKKIEHDDAFQVTIAQLRTIFARIDTFIQEEITDPEERARLQWRVDGLVAERAAITAPVVIAGEVDE